MASKSIFNFAWCDDVDRSYHSTYGKQEQMTKELRHLLNKVNRVTSCHRHGREVSQRDLDDLANAQVEYELVEQNKSKNIHNRLNELSAQLKDIRDGKVKAGVNVQQTGNVMTVSFTLSERIEE